MPYGEGKMKCIFAPTECDFFVNYEIRLFISFKIWYKSKGLKFLNPE